MRQSDLYTALFERSLKEIIDGLNKCEHNTKKKYLSLWDNYVCFLIPTLSPVHRDDAHILIYFLSVQRT